MVSRLACDGPDCRRELDGIRRNLGIPAAFLPIGTAPPVVAQGVETARDSMPARKLAERQGENSRGQAMFRKIVSAVIMLPLAIVIVAFAVANRQAITVSFDPFDSVHPAYAATLPLFVIVFVLLIAGVVVGGVASWLGQGSRRRSARRLDAEVRGLREEIAGLRGRLAAHEGAPPSGPSSGVVATPRPGARHVAASALIPPPSGP